MPKFITFLCYSFLLACGRLNAGDSAEIAAGRAPAHPQQPQLAVDEAGGVHLVYGIGDQVFYSRRSGGRFNEPTLVATVSNMSLGMRRGPRIAAGRGFVCLTAIGGRQGKGRDGELFAYRSTDEGKTWQGPVTVTDVPGAAAEGLQAMAAGPKGELCAVWLDFRGSGPKTVAISLSGDGGATWGKNRVVYQSPDGPVCPCCHPSAVYDAAGGLHVMWRNELAGNRDMYVCSSSDGGETFGQAAKLGEGTWPLKMCPMDGGMVVALPLGTLASIPGTLASGKLATIWRREKSIYLTLPDEPKERLLGPGEQPWLAATSAGPVAVWLKKRGETLYVLKPGDSQPSELAQHAADPVIATSLSGKGPIVAAWEERNDGRYAIRAQMLNGE